MELYYHFLIFFHRIFMTTRLQENPLEEILTRKKILRLLERISHTDFRFMRIIFLKNYKLKFFKSLSNLLCSYFCITATRRLKIGHSWEESSKSWPSTIIMVQRLHSIRCGKWSFQWTMHSESLSPHETNTNHHYYYLLFQVKTSLK